MDMNCFFSYFSSRINQERVDRLSKALPEFSVMEEMEEKFLRDGVDVLIKNGQLPTRDFECYVFGISESVWTFVDMGPVFEEFVCVYYIYLWSALKATIDGVLINNDKCDYFLYKIISHDFSNEKDLEMVAGFIRGLVCRSDCLNDFDVKGFKDANEEVCYDFYCLLRLADLFLQIRLYGEVNAEMAIRCSQLHSLVESKGGFIKKQECFQCGWDDSYRYDESWFDLIGNLEVPKSSEFYSFLIHIITR